MSRVRQPLSSLLFLMAIASALSAHPGKRTGASGPFGAVPVELRVDPAGQPLAATQIEQLLKMKILSQLVGDPTSSLKQGVSIALIDAPPAKVFRTLRDYEHFRDFMPYVARVVVDEHHDNRWLISYSIRGPLGIGNRDYQVEVFDEKELHHGVEVLVSRFRYTGRGNIKATSGTWYLIPFDGGRRTFVRCMVRTDVGGAFTTLLKNRIAYVGLSRVVEAVRKRVAAVTR